MWNYTAFSEQSARKLAAITMIHQRSGLHLDGWEMRLETGTNWVALSARQARGIRDRNGEPMATKQVDDIREDKMTKEGRVIHLQKIFLSGQNGSGRVDSLCQSHQRHPGGRLLHAQPHYHTSCCLSPSNHCFNITPTLSVSHCKWRVWHSGQLWPYVGMGSLGTRLHWEWNAMGDVAKVSPRIPSTSAQNTFLCSIIIHIIPSCQIYVAIDNPSLIPSIFCLTTNSYLWNYVRGADDVSHPENFQITSCWCFP